MASPPPYAVVTLLTSDSYLPGAINTLNSLLDVEPDRSRFTTLALVTPSTISHTSIQALQKVFDVVVGVEVITTDSWEELKLLGRRDLALTLTKLHLFRLTQYKKVIFLDADTLVLRPISHLFDLTAPFAAAPDQGWPDAFNSGVMVAEPSIETFDALVGMMKQRGSWDGGDQGLLNDFFPNWHRLSFTYNVTPSAYYTYAPAYQRHGQDASIIHFIGTDKPWKRGTRMTYDPEAASKDYYGLVNQWFDVFERHFGTISTYDCASRVPQPPAFFRSTFSSLPALGEGQKGSLQSQPSSPVPTISIHGPSESAPIPIARSHQGDVTWDASRSSPPRDGGFQARDLVIGDYSNAWDDPNSAASRRRFEAPQRYPSPPRETHDWYKEVMRSKPDPSAVKPVFPWEMPSVPPTPSGRTPARPSAPAPTRTFSDDNASRSQQAPTNFRGGSGFTNAWDAVPAIKQYADQLKQTTTRAPGTAAQKESGSSGSSGDGNRSQSQGGARKRRSASIASNKSNSGAGLQESIGLGFGAGGGNGAAQAKGGKDGDASSRDGDDEDDDQSTSNTEGEGGGGEGGDSEEEDRIQIRFRRAAAAASASGGELSPTNRRSKSGSSSSPENRSTIDLPPPVPSVASGATSPGGRTRKLDSRYVPTSPRQSRSHPAPAPAASPASSPHTSALSGTSPYLGQPSLHLAIPSPSGSPSASGGLPRSGPPSPRNGSSVALSPRAQAVRNSTHARLVASGSGVGDHAPPVVRATRVFRPETDTGVVKQQGLAALQRFVEQMSQAEQEGGAGGAEGQQQQQQQQQPDYGYQQYGGGGAGTGGTFRW